MPQRRLPPGPPPGPLIGLTIGFTLLFSIAALPAPVGCADGRAPAAVPGALGAPRPGSAASPARRAGGLVAPVCRAGSWPRRVPVPGRRLVASYASDRMAVANSRRRLAAALAHARTPAARAAALGRARSAFTAAILRDLAPHWCGTPWAFHGTTRAPGRGRIACGYFVTTLLSHAGLRVARAPLARRPSEAIIKSLVAERFIHRYSDVPLARFVARVAAGGDGLALVGLDNHVGFLRVADGRVTFLHASYLAPVRVVEEAALTSEALARSRYRVVGRLSDDPTLLAAWLRQTVLPTR